MWPLWSREGFAFRPRTGGNTKTREPGHQWILRGALAEISCRENGRAGSRERQHVAKLENVSKGYGEVGSLEGW